MVEIKYNDEDSWRTFHNHIIADGTVFGFIHYIIRIGDIVYSNNTKKFKVALEKEVAWAKLQA